MINYEKIEQLRNSRTTMIVDLARQHLLTTQNQLERVEADQAKVLMMKPRHLSVVIDPISAFKLSGVEFYRIKRELIKTIWGELLETAQTLKGGITPLSTVCCRSQIRSEINKILCKAEFGGSFHPDTLFYQAIGLTVPEVLKYVQPEAFPFPLAPYRRDIAGRLVPLTEKLNGWAEGFLPTAIPGVDLLMCFLPQGEFPALYFKVNPVTS